MALTATKQKFSGLLLLILFLSSCSNNPYKTEDLKGSTAFKAYSTELKYVDPVKSYYAYEAAVIDQVYEFLFQYDYLRRPYELIPCLAEAVPTPVEKEIILKEPYLPRRFNNSGQEIFNPKTVKIISYTIKIKKGVYYAPHECFSFNEIKQAHTRELKIRDFIYAFKRIADPKLGCPVFPVFVSKIAGLDLFYKYNQEHPDKPTDYTRPVSGLIAHDDYTLEILLKEKYPQILYWLAMHFTSPMPEEAVQYYKGEGTKYLPWPVGTGAYRLSSWKPRQEIILKKNPLFRDEYYPIEGMPGDREEGNLVDAGKKLPFIDKVIYKYTPESISAWSKFMQGYLDASGIGKEQFDKVITSDKGLSPKMAQKGIRLKTAVGSDIFYFGFNMLDPVVGGYTQEKKYLRRAIAKALDVNQYKKIFRNNRGIIPNGPVPPGIFGYEPNIKTYNNFDLAGAMLLLEKAGYKDGLDPETGQPLEIVYDNALTSGSASASRPHLQFFKEQIEKLGLRLKIASTDLNTYRKKILDGNYQIFESGWLLDYPDPENFLFLLYGPNGTVKHQADNRANYDNPEFNALFEQMETMENTSRRKEIIRKMIDIVNNDCPWIYLFHSEDYYLFHTWYKNIKVTDLINNKMKYLRIDPQQRLAYIEKYNKPVYWPLITLIILLIVSFIPAVISIRRKYQ